MKIYWISRRDQLEAIASTARQDISDRLSAMGPCTVAGLADALGYRPTALYQHLAALQRVGLVKSFAARGGLGRPATHYQMIAPLVRWARAPRVPANRPPMARAAKAMAARAAKDYARGFDVPHWTLEGPARNHWMFRLVARLSKPKLKKINKILDEVARLAYTPGHASGPLVSIACVLAPIPERARRAQPIRAGRRRQ